MTCQCEYRRTSRYCTGQVTSVDLTVSSRLLSHSHNDVESAVTPMGNAHVALEAAGAGIMQRLSLSEIGGKLVECGGHFELISQRLEPIAPECSGRMTFGANKMKEAGNNLAGIPKEKPKGKAWLKG